MLYERLRRWTEPLKCTPFHPQWLMQYGSSIEERLEQAHRATLEIGCADRWPEMFLEDCFRYVAFGDQETGMNLFLRVTLRWT